MHQLNDVHSHFAFIISSLRFVFFFFCYGALWTWLGASATKPFIWRMRKILYFSLSHSLVCLTRQQNNLFCEWNSFLFVSPTRDAQTIFAFVRDKTPFSPQNQINCIWLFRSFVFLHFVWPNRHWIVATVFSCCWKVDVPNLFNSHDDDISLKRNSVENRNVKSHISHVICITIDCWIEYQKIVIIFQFASMAWSNVFQTKTQCVINVCCHVVRFWREIQ